MRCLIVQDIIKTMKNIYLEYLKQQNLKKNYIRDYKATLLRKPLENVPSTWLLGGLLLFSVNPNVNLEKRSIIITQPQYLKLCLALKHRQQSS